MAARHGSHIDICLAEVIIVLSDIFRIVIAEVIPILDGFSLAETFILGSFTIAKAIVKAIILDYIVIIAEVIIVISDIFRIVIAEVIRILDGFALDDIFNLGSFVIAEIFILGSFAKAIVRDYIVIIEAFRLLFPKLWGSFRKSVHKGVRSQHLILC